jgi:hypothetical protein
MRWNSERSEEMNFFSRLFSGCWFSHGQLIRTRNPVGSLVLQCDRCGDEQEVLPPRELVRGPKLIADPVKGQPVLTAKRETAFDRRRRGIA